MRGLTRQSHLDTYMENYFKRESCLGSLTWVYTRAFYSSTRVVKSVTLGFINWQSPQIRQLTRQSHLGKYTDNSSQVWELTRLSYLCICSGNRLKYESWLGCRTWDVCTWIVASNISWIVALEHLKWLSPQLWELTRQLHLGIYTDYRLKYDSWLGSRTWIYTPNIASKTRVYLTVALWFTRSIASNMTVD
jgi:hypothetical protein